MLGIQQYDWVSQATGSNKLSHQVSTLNFYHWSRFDLNFNKKQVAVKKTYK